jgi:hypothetical protein
VIVFHGTTEAAAGRISAAGFLARGEHATRLRAVALDYAVLAMVAAEPVSTLLERGAKAALVTVDVNPRDRRPDPAPEAGDQSQFVLGRSAPVKAVEFVPVAELLREHASNLERWRALYGTPAAHLGMVR